MRRRLAAVILFLAGCGSEAAAPAPGLPDGPVPPKEGCGPERVEENEKLLVTACTEPSLADVRTLAVATWPATDSVATTDLYIRIGIDGIALAGGAPSPLDDEAFRAELRSAREGLSRFASGEGTAMQFTLAIERETRLRDVDRVVRVLAADGLVNGVLVLASGTLPRSAAPRHPELYERYSKEVLDADPSERATTIARRVEPLAARCAPIANAFESVAADDPSNRCERLMHAAAEGLVTCGCPEWEPELVSWLQVLVGPADAPRMHVDRIQLADTSPIVAKPDTTWGALVAERKAPFRTLWLDLSR
jgi:hypothetical protein